MEWFVQKARNGNQNVGVHKANKTVFLHSKYNPVKEASQLVGNMEIPIDSTEIMVIGMGAGYHIQELANQYPNLFITVIEFNYSYAKWAHTTLPLIGELDVNKKIKYIFSKNILLLKEMINRCISDKKVELYIYKPCLELIEDTGLVNLLKQIRLIKLSYASQKDKLENNFLLNTYEPVHGLNEYYNNLQNKDVILVSAGPSLTKQLSLLKEIADSKKFVLACVGTALKLLLQNKIIPQLVMISDANDAIMNQVVLKDVIDFPLFYLCTANHNAVKKYPGPKYIVWQKGYMLAEEYANKRNEPLIDTGGSVATTLLDLLVTCGAKSIALVGQDLAFTDNQTHASNINANKKVTITDTLIEVDDFYKRSKVYTPLNLFSYKVWMENYALTHHGQIPLWNCTEGGAFINNWKNESLNLYLETMKG